MNEEKKKRLEQLATLLDKLPPDKQEGIAFGLTLLAAFYDSEKKSA